MGQGNRLVRGFLHVCLVCKVEQLVRHRGARSSSCVKPHTHIPARPANATVNQADRAQCSVLNSAQGRHPSVCYMLIPYPGSPRSDHAA
jgi:hypothetical protein